MRGKSVLLIAGGALVLVLLVGMKMLLSDDAGAQPAPTETAPVATTVAAAKPATPVRKITPPVVMHAPVVAPAAVVTPTAPTAEAAPTPALEPPPGIDDPTPGTKTPIADKATLRDQMEAVTPYVQQCLQVGGDTTNATGTVLLTWTVASKGGKAIVESSGVDYDATDVTDQKLLDCLAATANKMQFQAVPGALPVIGRRKLTLTNGQLANQQFVSFSRIY